MNNQTKDLIQFGLLGIIALTVIYGTFIKSDPIPPRKSASTAAQQQQPQQPQMNDNQNPLQPSPDARNPMNPQQPGQQQPQEPPKPQGPPTNVSWEAMAHDFGKIKQETTNEKVFSFTNTGDNPLIIQSAQGSCGCTVPEYPREPIAPGESGEIRVEYKPGQQKGRQSKTVTIQANTNPPQTTLTISADVEEES